MPNDSKIVLFPQVQERILDKGYQALNEKNFEVAYELFTSMKRNGIGTPQSELAVVICLVEMGRTEQAIDYCEEILATDFLEEVLDTFISILLQTDNFERAQQVLIQVLEEEDISQPYRIKLQNLLQVAEKGSGNKPLITLEQVEKTLFHETHLAKQMECINLLTTEQVETMLPLLENFLQENTKNALVKTQILQLLKDSEVSRKVQVCKLGKCEPIIPTQLNDEMFYFAEEVSEVLSSYLAHDNPSMLEMLIEQWNYFTFCQYPFPFTPKDTKLWATALYVFGTAMYATYLENEEVMAYYAHHEREIEKIMELFMKITEENEQREN